MEARMIRPRQIGVLAGVALLGALAVLILLVPRRGAAAGPADLVVLNAKIVTLDPGRPEASALAARGEFVVAVGDAETVKPWIGEETVVLNGEGRLVVPGFIDAHAHFLGVGYAKMELDLAGAGTWEEVVARVAEAVKKSVPGAWITGGGWHQEKWNEPPTPNVDGLPVHDALSEISPENPVLLTHASGHLCFANAKAMALAKVDEKTRDPGGGEIVRDAEGKPIGVFRETAAGLIRNARARTRKRLGPEAAAARRLRAVALATRECLSKGVTSVHDAGVSFSTVDLYEKLARRGELGVRLYVMVNESDAVLSRRLGEARVVGSGNHRLTVRAVKRLIDGALGSHGAWMLEPYDDLPSSTGLNTTSPRSIRETAKIARKHGFQLCVHAIGDRGNREVLDVYEAVLGTGAGKADHRWRVEHAQHLHPDDIPRFARLGVIASMQGIHCTSDGPWVTKRIGKRRAREGAYAWRALLDAGAVVCNGTDAPIEDIAPLANFHASVARRMKDGAPFFPGQCMTREEALRSCTANAAHAAFEEEIKGSLAPGKLADFVLLSRDILTVPEGEIPGTKVLATVVGGKVAYRAEVEGTRREGK
jgi:predicted amidohydrolase YtcJ